MINEPQPQLSEREQAILRLVATGLSNQQIANQLGISVNTVKVHVRNVFSKIGAASRTEATLYAVRTGLVAVDRADALGEGSAVDTLPALDTLPPAIEDEAPSDPITAPAEAAPDPDVVAVPAARVYDQAPTVAAPPPAARRRSLWPLVLVSVLLVALVSGVLLSGVLRQGAATTPSGGTDPSVSAALSGWQPLPALPTPRAAFATANLGEFIYVIGGENNDGVLDSVARYDARTQVWTDRSRKPTAVADVRAVRIGDKLYVPGGRTGTDPSAVTDVFERYDPRAERWETLAKLPAPRSGYALAASEGKLYLFGGWDGTTYRSEAYVYEPDGDTWRELPPLPTARAFAEAGTVEGTIYVVGGENERGPLAANEVFAPAQADADGQAWSTGAPMTAPRSRFGLATALSQIYVVGGGDASAAPLTYETRTDRWQPFAAPAAPVGQQPGAVMLNTQLVSLGGRQGDTFLDGAQSFRAVYTQAAPVAQ